MHTVNKQKTEFLYVFLIKLAVLFLIMAALFFIVLFLLPEKKAAARNFSGGTYTIHSVQIKEGDSLWSLATKYYTEEFSSIPQYIMEIKRINNISSDILYADNYLLIPQYVAE